MIPYSHQQYSSIEPRYWCKLLLILVSKIIIKVHINSSKAQPKFSTKGSVYNNECAPLVSVSAELRPIAQMLTHRKTLSLASRQIRGPINNN